MDDLRGMTLPPMGSGERAAMRVPRSVGTRLAWQEPGAPAVGPMAGSPCPATPVEAATIEDGDVEFLARLSLGDQTQPMLDFVESLQSRRVPLTAIYLDLLQPAARKLGQWWDADACTFAEVTIGMVRLHAVLRDLGPEFRGTLESPCAGGRLLLAAAPGEQHTFGLRVVADFFARAGWEVLVPEKPGSAARAVRDDWFDVVGLAAGSDSRLDALAAEIARIRAASRNGKVGVLVGGPLFVAHPEWFCRVAADAAAGDARDAPRVAQALLDAIRGAR